MKDRTPLPDSSAPADHSTPTRLPASGDAEAPANRLSALGPRPLSSVELITLLLSPGLGSARARRAAIDLSEHFAARRGGIQLRNVAAATVCDVARVCRIGRAAAARVLAALELGRRAQMEGPVERPWINTTSDIYEYMKLRLSNLRHEEFWVLTLNTQNRLLREVEISRGILDSTLAHPREVFRPALEDMASAIVVVHNHPSGESSPSTEDVFLTEKLRNAGEALGIPLLDHMIIGDHRYYSFAEKGRWVPTPPDPLATGPGKRFASRPRRGRHATSGE
jgi:DNA repair protein RadC